MNCIEGNTVRRKFNNGVVTKELFLFYLFIYYNKINFSKEYFNLCLNINSLNTIEEKLSFVAGVRDFFGSPKIACELAETKANGIERELSCSCALTA